MSTDLPLSDNSRKPWDRAPDEPFRSIQEIYFDSDDGGGLVSRAWRDGTPERPFIISMKTFRDIRNWAHPKELALELLPIHQQQEFIAACRVEAVTIWPWWYPNCHVYVE